MVSQPMRRLAAASTAAFAVVAFSGCSDDGGGSDGDTQQVDVLMNWFAQAEQGGYWQAGAEQLAEDGGVELNVRQGGPQIQTIPQVASGEAMFGVAQADELLLARAEGAPVVQVFGGMEKYLQCMMYHPSQDIDGWNDLNGYRVAVAPSGGYWPYIKGKYNLDVEEVNFTGSMGNFAADERMVQQCFITSEPFVAQQQGIEIETMMVADSGYNPYSQGLFTTERVIEENPELVSAVVAAAQEGWEQYREDPSAGNELILDTNSDMSQEKLDFAHEELATGGYLGDPVGEMTAERWQTMADQLRQAGVLEGEANVNEVWTNEYLP